MSVRVGGFRLVSLVALLVALFVVVGQPVQAHSKQRIAVAHVGDPGDGLDGDPTDGEGGDPGDGFGGDPGDGDVGDPTDGNGRGASAGDPGDGDGVAVAPESHEPDAWTAGADAWSHFGSPLATTTIVALLIARIRGH